MRLVGWFDRRILLATSLATAAIIVAHLDFAFGFVASGLLGLGLLLILVIALAIALGGLFRRSRAALVIGSYAMLSVLISGALGSAIVQFQTLQSFERGDAIASALANFRSTGGGFPDSLGALVPKHLETMPLTSMGLFKHVPFSYSVAPGHDEYRLGFSAPGWLYCHRTFKRAEWVCDD